MSLYPSMDYLLISVMTTVKSYYTAQNNFKKLSIQNFKEAIIAITPFIIKTRLKSLKSRAIGNKN